MTLAGSIKSLTRDGHSIAQFLVHTMEGHTDGVKAHHRLDAAKQLIKYGFSDEDSDFWGLIPTPEEIAAKRNASLPSQDEGQNESENPAPPVTYLDILNFDIARQIRDETEEGHHIVDFLVKIMNGRQRPFTPKKLQIKPSDRIAVAKELLIRGFGDFGNSRSGLSVKKDDYETVHDDIGRRIRQFTEYGSDITRFLLDVMSGELRDEGFTISHRVGAAKELLRRAYDINFDGVTYEQVEEYWRAQRAIGWTERDELELQSEITIERIVDNTPSFSVETDGASTPSPMMDENSGFSAFTPEVESQDVGGNPVRSEHVEPPVETTQFALSLSDNANSELSEEIGSHDFSLDIDCYYEPLTPEDQAIFNYELHMESGEFEEGDEILESIKAELIRPSEGAWREYHDALKRIRQIAADEGVPVLPNPLAGALTKPTIRSP